MHLVCARICIVYPIGGYPPGTTHITDWWSVSQLIMAYSYSGRCLWVQFGDYRLIQYLLGRTTAVLGVLPNTGSRAAPLMY